MPVHHLIDPQRLIKVGTEMLSLQEVEETGGPDLTNAATLTSWAFVDATWKGLAGYVYGHAKLGSGRIVTTPLVSIDTELRWARTFNTLYRLQGSDEDKVRAVLDAASDSLR